jgi:putative hemolysin
MFLAALHLAMTEGAPLSAAGVALNIALILLLVMMSGVFSGSETVLFSLTPVQLERAALSRNPLRRLAAQLMARPKQTLTAVLLANTAVNVLLFATSYVLFQRLSARYEAAWITPVSGLASVLLVVIGGEVVPKVIGVTLADRLAPIAGGLMRVTGIVALPLGRAIDWLLAEPFARVVLGKSQTHRDEDPTLSTIELKTLLEMSQRAGTIRWLEDTFLRAIVDLGQTRVRDVMVPRVEMVAYDVDAPADGLRDLIRETRFKKIPVYEGSKDNMIGLVYAKILFLNPDKPLREIVSPVRLVPELASCERLLVHFRESRSQVAIVIDEYGGVAGLVTLEDVLEEIVGELHEPEDEYEEPDIRALADGAYDISGALSVQYWADTFRLPPRVERVATVGGLVMAKLGRAGRVGDVVRLGNVELKVAALRHRRIHRLHLRLLDHTIHAGENI